jgi:hypothetical protein
MLQPTSVGFAICKLLNLLTHKGNIMAIQLNLETSHFGIPFAGAYFRIVMASVSRTRDADKRHIVTIDVVGYATQPTNEDTKDVDFRRYHCALSDIESQSGNNFLTNCYAWVMSQEDMAGSIGV